MVTVSYFVYSVGWAAIILLAIIWLLAMKMNVGLLYGKDAMLQGLPFYQRLISLLSGPILIILISMSPVCCPKCGKTMDKCPCDRNSTRQEW